MQEGGTEEKKALFSAYLILIFCTGGNYCVAVFLARCMSCRIDTFILMSCPSFSNCAMPWQKKKKKERKKLLLHFRSHIKLFTIQAKAQILLLILGATNEQSEG